MRPWPWADTWPVARLDLEPKGGRLVVLADASGRSLALIPHNFEPLRASSGWAMSLGSGW